MGSVAIVLNGVPGSGKTTLAPLLARELGFPVVARDAIKEALADAVAVPLPTSRVGAVASDAMWALVGMIDDPVIVESFWLTGRDEVFFERGLIEGRVEVGVELWCEVSIDLARARFIGRPRHHAHSDHERLSEWEEMARSAKPISHFPIVPVDTNGAVDVPVLARAIKAILEPTHP